MKILRKKGEEISPNMIGLFFEDINFAADGGLYAELIENRSFEAREAFGIPTNLYSVEDSGYAWEPVSTTSTMPTMKYVTGTPLAEENPHYLRFTSSEKGQGFANKAYDGIYLKKGESVNVVFYARVIKYDGNVKVSIRDSKCKDIYCEETVTLKKHIPFLPFRDLTVELKEDIWGMKADIDRLRAMDKTGMVQACDWVKYETVLTAVSDIKEGKFVIELEDKGLVEFDFISVIPTDAVEGVFRRDLFEALKAINPGFIRFPGGCIVEGISLENRYRWKRTVGDVTKRKVIPNLWSFVDDRSLDVESQRPDAHYGQSYGIGFYEYFLLCELLGAKAVPVLSMGAACQFRSTQIIDVNSDELDEYIQDAIDLIEFANGSTDTKWGALRASMGHPESFNLDMLAIGNEQWETETLNLFERNDKFEKAIHAVYPGFKLLGTAGPVIDMVACDQAWDYYRNGKKKQDDFCYAVDEHYYKDPEWMYSHVDLYDYYDRALYVFAGEYAAHTENKGNNIEAALAEAAMLTGIEKNAGVVKLASYAPLFNRIGHSQWKPDMIWFDSDSVTLTPNYYVQKMYANNLGTHTLLLDDEAIELRKKGIYVSLSVDECTCAGGRAEGLSSKDNAACASKSEGSGEIILKVVNTTKDDFVLELTDEDGVPIYKRAKVEVLHATGEEPEDLPQPSCVDTRTIDVAGSLNIEAKSFVVVRME